MIIKNNTTSIGGVDSSSTKPSPDSTSVRQPSDKVSLEDARQTQGLIQAVQARTGAAHGLRVEQIKAAIKTGSYQPNVSQLAERLLDAAELDARLTAMLRS